MRVVAVDDARLLHLGQVVLVEAHVHALALLAVYLRYRRVVLPGGDLVGERPEVHRVVLLAQVVEDEPAARVAQKVEDSVLGEFGA